MFQTLRCQHIIISMSVVLTAGMALPATADKLFDERFECLMEPSTVVKVSSETPGVVDEIMVERGGSVEKGDLLFALTTGRERAAVALAQARLDFSQRKVVRNEELYQQQLISIHEKDEMATESRIAALELQEAQENLKIRSVKSKISGVVVERTVAAGEYVGVDPIITVATLDPLHVEVVVPAEAFGTIEKGANALLYPFDPVGGEYKAKVVVVDRLIDAASGTFGVRLRLPNPGYRLPAGLGCEVKFL